MIKVIIKGYEANEHNLTKIECMTLTAARHIIDTEKFHMTSVVVRWCNEYIHINRDTYFKNGSHPSLREIIGTHAWC